MPTVSLFYTLESRTQHQELQKSEQGFTLLELLASTVLLLLLFGAMIFNFAALRGGADLDEGVARFETFLRFARAESARSGLRLRIEFVTGEDLNEAVLPDLSQSLHQDGLASPRLLVERQPLENSGVFTPMADPAWLPPGLRDLVGVESAGKHAGTQIDSDLENEYGLDFELLDGEIGSLTPLTFYPDGSSDSSEIVLVSRSHDDSRRIRLRILGITGQVVREDLVSKGSLDAASNDSLTQSEEASSP
jgi:type II secretory pathway pseudopilin PulG